MTQIDFTPELVQRFKEQRRCMKCKRKTFEDLVLCERCREWQYCCIQCLESDRDYHTQICDKIGLKKGILRLNENMHVYRAVKLKAKFLDENGDVRLKNSNEEDRNGASKDNKSVSETNGKKKTGRPSLDQARNGIKSVRSGKKSDRNVRKPNGNGGKADGNGGKPNGNDGKQDENGGMSNGNSGKADGNGGKPNGNGGKADGNGGKPNGNGGKADGNGGKRNGNGGKADGNGGKPNGNDGKQDENGGKPNGKDGKPDENGGKPNGNHGKPDESAGKPNGNDGKSDENGAKPGHKRKNKKNKSQRKQAQKEKIKSGESNPDLTSKAEEKTVSAADKKSVLKSLSKGRFGGPVRCNKDDETGVSFGKDWFKVKQVSKPKRGFASKTGGVKSTTTKPAGKANELSFSDIYGDISDDEENRDEVKSKSKETKAGRDEKEQGLDDSSQVPDGAMACGGEPEVELTGQEIVVYDEETAEKEMKRSREGGKPVVIKKCYHCQKRSFNLKTCGRCKSAVYCNRTCQMSDFATHKEICKRRVRFTTARDKLPWEVRHMAVLGMCIPRKISPDLDDVPDPIRYLFPFLQPKTAVLLEIIGSLRHPLLHAIRVKDLRGKETNIFFGEDVYFHFVGLPFKIPMRLDKCLIPGNFILLLNPHFDCLIDGTIGIVVEHLEEVHFVFMK